MPQMAPLFWLNLFMLFTFVYILFLIMNYFIWVPGDQQASAQTAPLKSLHWKW